MVIDPETIKKYSEEMLNMRSRAVQNLSPEQTVNDMSGEGGLLVRATTLKELYPIENAVVTVYEGDGENRNELYRVYTDESGKTEVLRLKAPKRSLSESADAVGLPYASYNVSVKADGYAENIHLNVPVFPDTVSVQTADMLSLAAAGENTAPRVFDESQRYEL